MASKTTLLKKIADKEAKVEQHKEKMKRLQASIDDDKKELVILNAFEIQGAVNDIAPDIDVMRVLNAVKNNDLEQLLDLMNDTPKGD